MRVHRSARFPSSAVLALLALASPASLCLADASLFPDQRPTIIRSVTDMAIADFNGDGHLDVAAGRNSIHLGNGDGTLRIGPRILPSLASLWGEIRVGNFNGDGIPDVVGIGRYNAPRIALGKGDGSFEEAVEQRYDGYSVVVTDINADGKDDLAYTSYSSSLVLVGVGAGDGTFATHEYHLGGYPTSTAAGDFDGDGTPDLVVLRYKAYQTDSQDVAVLLGWHDGTFEQEHRFALDSYCHGWGAAVTDFNHDTHLDLALGCSGTGRVHMRLGNGDGTFQAGPVLSGNYGEKLFLSTEDIDRDGNQDLLASPGLKIYHGKGDGTFLAPVSHGPSYGSAMAADFNEDGHLDLAIERADWVEIELGDGTGQFRAPPQHHTRFATGNSPADIVSLDLNADGALDLVTANHGSSDLSILLGLDDGTFEQEFRVVAADQPRQLAPGDFNGDGLTDLALATDGSSEQVWVLQGFGNGILALPVPLPYSAPGGIAVADFDLDGRADLAVRSEDRIVVLGGMADGSFSLRHELPASASPPPWIPTFDIVAADMNQDGHADLVTAIAEYVDEFLVHLSDGQGGFIAPTVTPASRTINGPRFVVDDFDADQIPDIVVLGGYSTLLCPGRGDGTLEPCHSDGDIGWPRVAVDLDGNGALDVVSEEWNSIGILLNHGSDGGFMPDYWTPPLAFATGPSPEGVTAGDFNGDGLQDLAVANSGSDDISVLLHTGAVPSFPPIPRVSAPVEVECIAGSGTVVLDGSASIDGNSSPGTHDDIVSFEWRNDALFLGSGEIVSASLPVGAHSLTLTVTDQSGLSAEKAFEVEVVDAPPELTVTATSTVLWPPNHRMVAVQAVVSSSDACSGAPTTILQSVVSDEPDDAQGAGDGNTENDIQISDDLHFALRAERDGHGNGRIYTVVYQAEDASGNSATETFEVIVPHDLGGSTEPLVLSLLETVSGTALHWSEVGGAVWYDVVRGDLRTIKDLNGAYHLGSLTCIAAGTSQTSTAGLEDTSQPALGKGYFYLAAYDDGSWSGYGTESAAKERFVPPGQDGCH